MSDRDPENVALSAIENAECSCHYVDIGVGHQKAAEDPTCPVCKPLGLALSVVGALHAAGVLLPAGGESREVFDVETRGCHWPGFENEAAAWRQFAEVKAWPEKPKVWIVRRTVTVWPDGRRHVSPGERLGGDAEDGAP